MRQRIKAVAIHSISVVFGETASNHPGWTVLNDITEDGTRLLVKFSCSVYCTPRVVGTACPGVRRIYFEEVFHCRVGQGNWAEIASGCMSVNENGKQCVKILS